MIGAIFKYHFNNQPITVTVEDPKSPLTAMFKEPLELTGEIYTFSMDTYSRDNLRVLTSVDYSKMSEADRVKESYPRSDHDYPLSWVRRDGNGRVFYTALGQRREDVLPQAGQRAAAGGHPVRARRPEGGRHAGREAGHEVVMRTSFRAGSLLLLCFAGAVLAQEQVTLDGRPVRLFSNDKLTLAVRSVGGGMTQLLMRDDPEKLNPLQGLGHFVCVDGFGPVSREERAAGLPGHGEAHRVPWEMLSAEKKDGTLTVAFTATLPIVQETFRRTIRMVDGESVVYIDSELESLLGFDRPINWGEHATIGGPVPRAGEDRHRDVGEAVDDALVRVGGRRSAGSPQPGRLQGIHVAHGADGRRAPGGHADRAHDHAGHGPDDVADGSVAGVSCS